MSLASLAIRLATIRALKGRTFAGEKVFDSKIEPIDLVARQGNEFVIVVTTDDDEMDVTGRDLRAGDHKLELVIEVAATAKLTVTAGDGEESEVISIPATDAGLEASLNLIGWQIARALSAGGGEWGDLWRSMVMRVHSVASRRGADDANGVRYAARQYIYRIDHIAEPEPGVPPTDIWERIVSMLKADAEFAGIGKIVEATISGEPMEPWERVRASLGLADDASGHFSEWPFVPDEVAKLAEIATGDGRVLDESVAEAAAGPEGE